MKRRGGRGRKEMKVKKTENYIKGNKGGNKLNGPENEVDGLEGRGSRGGVEKGKKEERDWRYFTLTIPGIYHPPRGKTNTKGEREYFHFAPEMKKMPPLYVTPPSDLFVFCSSMYFFPILTTDFAPDATTEYNTAQIDTSTFPYK